MKLPATYGEVLMPLDLAQLPEPLLSQCAARPLVRSWVVFADRVQRAEKVSAWTQWTPDEHDAYDRGDWRAFSRLRGYSEAEIADFDSYLALCAQVDAAMGEPGFCESAGFALTQLLRTSEYERVECMLLELVSTQPPPGLHPV